MNTALRINHGLIVLFALASGVYKVSFGEADVEIYAALGFSAYATAVFGAGKAVLGLATLYEPLRKGSAVGLALCNMVATAALFASGVQPFGWISWVFVGMALAVLARPGSAPAGE